MVQNEAKSYLKSKDKVLAVLLEKVADFDLSIQRNYYESLAESIVSQQLSVKAADTIWKRFILLLPDQKVIPENVLAIDNQKIRDAGISWSKISYIKDLSQKTLDSHIIFEEFENMSDEEIINELIKVKGIGRWTAEMFLMFAMGRPDVFSYGDLGLRRALQRFYDFDHEPTVEEMEKIVSVWSPYKTYASRVLWRALEL
ncbi:MAG: DNA-3-methyladenine glycosylase [Patescibacteria group bacterium]|jgi:DNA-3-methyladenine glycosylase II|nr:DNA-3-methyladenine glycosylase [Patescibacteria group bacterium]